MKKPISISIDKELIKIVKEKVRKEKYRNPSHFVEEAILEKLGK